jgi:hypothetical protein
VTILTTGLAETTEVSDGTRFDRLSRELLTTLQGQAAEVLDLDDEET